MGWQLFVAEFSCMIFAVIGALVVGSLLVCMFQTLMDLPTTYHGFAAPGWYLVANEFKKHVENGYFNGGGFVVYHKGQLVVEFFGGYADYGAELPWDKTTLSCLFGCTKGIGAIVIAMLVDRGLLDYSAPVANYWPDFASHGKESITVEQLLSHQADLIDLHEKFSLYEITTHPDRISKLLAAAEPQWEPGSDHGFHSVTMGLYMDQLVRRVDHPKHRRLDQFFAEEVAREFGIDCYIGVPRAENSRCAKIEHFTLDAFLDVFTSQRECECGRKDVVQLRKRRRTMLDDVAEAKVSTVNLFNDPSFREIPCVSSHGFATVTAVAKLYGILANGGSHEINDQHEKKTLLSTPVVQKLNRPLASGMDFVYCVDSTVGRGTVIMRSKDGHDIFGHPGFCRQAAFADPKHKLSWAYINYPSMFWYAGDHIYLRLVEKVYDTVRELERKR